MAPPNRPSPTRFPAADPPYRRALRRLHVVAPLLTLLLVGGAWLRLGDRLWSIGPVAPAHARFAGECGRCHADTGRRLRAVDERQAALALNDQCLRCHGRAIGHSSGSVAGVGSAGSATHHERSPGDGRSCSTCHREHQGGSLLPDDDSACVQCHRDLEAVESRPGVAARIGAFSDGGGAVALGDLALHPEFALLAERRPDGAALRFNHRRHLMDDKLPGPDGRPARLVCVDCHRPVGAEPLPFRFPARGLQSTPATARGVNSGAAMAPLSYAAHCAGCHATQVPSASGILLGDDQVAPGEVPHAPPGAIRNYLRSQLRPRAASIVPRGAPASPVRPEAIGAIEAALYRAGDGVCRRCHEVKEGRADEGVLPAIVPTAIPSRFFPRASFNHGRHTAAALGEPAVAGAPDCLVCHGRALESTRTSDLLLPGIMTCRRCHGPSPARGGAETHSTGGVAARCTTCHGYHVPPPDALGPSPVADGGTALLPSLVAAGMHETREGLRAESTPLWRLSGFFDLPTRVWGRPDIAAGSDAFRREVFRRYGLHFPDEPNDGLPMGLLRTRRTFDGEPGLTVTCELCHSSRLFGRLVVGQPNPWADMERIWSDLETAGAGSFLGSLRKAGAGAGTPLYHKNPPGNPMVNGADHLGLIGLLLRNEDLSGDLGAALRWQVDDTELYRPYFDALAYVKTAPWYTYATRKAGASGLYWDGGQPKDGNFAAYTYMVAFRDVDGRDLAAALAAWKRSGPAFLASLGPPRYPFSIDPRRAAAGRTLYDRHCARCHGVYGAGEPSPETLSFPGNVFPAAEVGTDPKRARFPAFFIERTRVVLKEDYAVTDGYAAPPLTAVWARAPYLHNGSVPTLAELLDPPSRRARFVFAADPNRHEDYDEARVGWRVDPVPAEPDPLLRVYDPSRTPGLSNGGHGYGAELAAEEKVDLIEFLKTL